MQVGLGGDTTALLEDLIDALVGQAGAFGQTVGGDAEGRQELLAKQANTQLWRMARVNMATKKDFFSSSNKWLILLSFKGINLLI